VLIGLMVQPAVNCCDVAVTAASRKPACANAL
jgi:hypothetical protein